MPSSHAKPKRQRPRCWLAIVSLVTAGCGSVRDVDAPAEVHADIASDDARAKVDPNVTIVPHPSWTCGLPDGIPSPALGKLAFVATFAVTSRRAVGATQFGQRELVVLGAGNVTGPRIEATLQPGGFELPLTLQNGAVELEQLFVLRDGRGASLLARTCGVAAPGGEVRIVVDLEAANDGPHAALQRATLVGTRALSADGTKLTLTVTDVTGVARTQPTVVIDNPPGVRDQSWACKTLSGKRGAEMYRETVGIGTFLNVGVGKRGDRTIIPITGGTMTGRIAGRVLPLGYDMPLFGARIVIDARYAMETDDGELVLVRNCGALGALVPVFEAREAGRYAFVNEDEWLSSDPGIGFGSVSLQIFERR
ncbi:MAG: DUF3237 family protein [Polyangiales bacterium]